MPQRFIFSLLNLFCLTALISGAWAQSKEDLLIKGPLPHRNLEPLNAPFLLPQPMAAGTLTRGRARLDARLEIVNNLVSQRDDAGHLYVTDFEEQRLTLDYARGLGRRQEIGAQVILIARNGGFLDKFINTMHHLFGLAGGERDALTDSKNTFTVRNADTRTVIDRQKNIAGFGDTVLEYRYGLTELPPDARHSRIIATTLRALVKLPTGKTGPLFGSGAFDAGIGVALTSLPDRRWVIHGNASLVRIGKPDNEELKAKRLLVHGLLAVEYIWDGRTSQIFQIDENPPVFRSGLKYPDGARRCMTIGVWRQISGANRVYLLMSENDFGPLAKRAPDVGFAAGIRWGL